MDTKNSSKLKRMLTLHQPGTILLSKLLLKQGISRDLQKAYRKGGWLESIGPGAYKRPDDHITWRGALFAVQHQANVNVHVGATSAISMQGLSHYLRQSDETLFLFTQKSTVVPKWFMTHKWGNRLRVVKTSFLPDQIGLTAHEDKGLSIKIATPERAILETLYLVPKEMDLTECLLIMEGLSNLRPKLIQQLLESCKSVKVKRLFLFLAGKVQHQWLQFLDKGRVDLGTGDRSIAKGGVYDPKFRIVIPKELA